MTMAFFTSQPAFYNLKYELTRGVSGAEKSKRKVSPPMFGTDAHTFLS